MVEEKDKEKGRKGDQVAAFRDLKLKYKYYHWY